MWTQKTQLLSYPDLFKRQRTKRSSIDLELEKKL